MRSGAEGSSANFKQSDQPFMCYLIGCHDFPYLSMAASISLLLHTYVVDMNIRSPHLCQLYNYLTYTALLLPHDSLPCNSGMLPCI